MYQWDTVVLTEAAGTWSFYPGCGKVIEMNGYSKPLSLEKGGVGH